MGLRFGFAGRNVLQRVIGPAMTQTATGAPPSMKKVAMIVIDLEGKSHVLCALDRGGDVVVQTTFSATRKAVEDYFAA